MATVFSSVTGRECGAFLCCNINAFIQARSPVDCSIGQARFPLINPSGRVLRNLDEVGTGEITIAECDCETLLQQMRESGLDDVGEWGHELVIERECDNGQTEALFVGPINSQLSAQDGSVTFFASDRLVWLARVQLIDDIFGQFQVSEIVRNLFGQSESCLLYTSPSPRDLSTSRMPSSA